MGGGCSKSSPTKAAAEAPAPLPKGPQPGHIYLSFHPPDTGEQRPDGGDGAAARIRDWLTSRGYVVQLGQPDPDAMAERGEAVRSGPAGVQSGLQQSWQARMLAAVEGCQAFIALCSQRYGTHTEAGRELNAADSLSASATLLIPLWHSGPWPPEGPLQPLLANHQRTPRGPRPLSRAILDSIMGELLERLQQAGCMPAAAGGAGGAGREGVAGASSVAVEQSLDAHFVPGPSDPPEADYVVVRCYTGQLQELADRMAMTVRPTIFDMNGETFSGDLPVLPVPFIYSAPAGGGAPDPATPASGGSLLIARPHVTLRNGALKLRQDQELRITGQGVVLDTITLMIEPRQGPHGGALGGGGGGFGGGAPRPPAGASYESGRAMMVVVGAVTVRILKCQLTNHGPHLALWLANGAQAAMRECDVEAPSGGGVWVRDGGSHLTAQSCHVQRCSGPCLKLEAGGGAQLQSCSVVDSADHNALLVGSGSRVRADRCVISGSKVGVNLFAGATAELVGCEVRGNALAGAEVTEPGTSLTAVETKFTANGQSGVMVAMGASASLTSCTVTGNKTHGVLIRGDGTVAALRQVNVSYNGQAGAMISDRARAELATCEATGNKVCGLVVWGAGTTTKAADCKLVQNAQAGLAIEDGGVADLAKCWVKGNKLPSRVSGAGSKLLTLDCVLDPKPNLASGGVHEVVDPKAKKK